MATKTTTKPASDTDAPAVQAPGNAPASTPQRVRVRILKTGTQADGMTWRAGATPLLPEDTADALARHGLAVVIGL